MKTINVFILNQVIFLGFLIIFSPVMKRETENTNTLYVNKSAD